ncbi:MAG: methyltransferase type 11 [Flavobacteriaceae bacterium]|nr:MAG: methyltransferase type 11 [Flavobacteriaceae bacterium]
MEIKRRNFQGALNILSFNRHFYVFGLIALSLIILSFLIFNWSTLFLWITILSFLYGLIMPLIVSAYVYDFSGYYNFDWLKNYNFKDAVGKQILNINAGFDETSFIIKNNFPKSELHVFDFYNAKQHTEPAIIRARKVSMVYPNTQQINSNSIPLKDNSVDLIFLLSAAHEIRSQEEKIQFLKECNRVCKPDANVIMIEHLRDFPNFVAFTIGFTHFFSKSTWKKAFQAAGFSTFTEQKFTPFMSIFNSRP